MTINSIELGIKLNIKIQLEAGLGSGALVGFASAERAGFLREKKWIESAGLYVLEKRPQKTVII